MNRVSLTLLMVLAASAGCAPVADAQTQPPIERARISPSVVHLAPGESQQFKVVIRAQRLKGAVIAETVTWAVNNIPGGNDLVGFITSTGLYTAPVKTPRPRELHICAEVPGAVNQHLWGTVLMEGEGPAYELIGEWSEPVADPEHLKDPHCIAVDRDHNLIVADYNGSRVARFKADGTYLGEIGLGTGEAPGFVIKPRVVHVDRNGNLFVSDQKHAKPRIQVFSPEGQFLRIFAEKGTGPGQILRAHGLAFDSQDRLYVVDVDAMRINIFDQEGRFLNRWGVDGAGLGEFNAPHGIAIDANNDVFVVGYYGPCQKFTADGKFLEVFAEADPPDGAVYFHSICSDRWGNVYLTVRGAAGYGGAVEDNEGNRVSVMKYNNNGDYVSSLNLGVKAHAENWATVDEEGTVYAIFVGNERLGVEILAPR